MKSSLDVVDLLYVLIKNSALNAEISGLVCKYKRPINSENEDIVINSLPVNKQDVQRGMLNVNIHVPDLQLPGTPIDRQPDTARLRTLTNMTIELLEEYYGAAYLFEVDDDNVLPDENNHFSNIRVSFFSPK